MDWLTQDSVMAFLGDALSKQITQFTVAFSLAAWLHAGRVKKEIKAQFEALISVIKQDLNLQAERLGKLEGRMSKIENQQKQGEQ